MDITEGATLIASNIDKTTPTRFQHPEASGETPSQCVFPVPSECPIFFNRAGSRTHVHGVRGVEHYMIEGFGVEWRTSEIHDLIRVHDGSGSSRPGIGDNSFASYVHVQASWVPFIKPEHAAATAGIQY